MDFTKVEGILHDKKLVNVIGYYSTELPTKVFRRGRARTTHGIIQYATNRWTAWCLYLDNPGTRESFIQCKLNLFHYLSVLNFGCIKLDNFNSQDKEINDSLIDHAKLFPPTEQTYALQEILHVPEKVRDIGPPRFNNLLMYKRVNKTLKGMIKNLAKSLPSIVKAYAVTL